MAIGRREAAISLVSGAALAANVLPKSAWAADTEASLIAEIKEIRSKLDLNAINTLIDEEKWDAARSIWKVPPVNYAWEQSQNKKNPLRKLADLRDDIELLKSSMTLRRRCSLRTSIAIRTRSSTRSRATAR